MKRSSMRFTIRRTMLAVAAAGVILGAERLSQRRAYFLERAAVDADRASDFDMGRVCLADEFDNDAVYVKLRAHWAAMARKYRLAAARPWLPVEPDPPQPVP
jgi:hypothetical protein